MENKGYKRLKVWEKAHHFAMSVYKISGKFPKEEMYGLTSQLRRAAFSVPLNIVEGQASLSRKTFINFLCIANRSLVETEYLLEVAKELSFIDLPEYERLEAIRNEVAAMLLALIKSMKNKHAYASGI